jgi:hypothetical protein
VFACTERKFDCAARAFACVSRSIGFLEAAFVLVTILFDRATCWNRGDGRALRRLVQGFPTPVWLHSRR